jgi:peptide/nickel transport system substrate-binding protein
LVAAGAAAFGLNQLNKPQANNNNQAASTKKTVPLLKIGVTQPFPSSFYPASELSIFPGEANNQIFEGLTKFQNQNQLVPNLAVSWSNPDNTTWDFKLKSGVKFHNGKALDAAAVKASLDALKPLDAGQAYEATIKSVTAKDSATVEIVTSAPDPLLPSELANLYIYDTTGKQNDPSNGTGPYDLKPGTKLSSNSLDLVAINDYHGGAPTVKEIDFQYYSDSKAELADLKAAKLDIADLPSLETVNSVKQYGYQSYLDSNVLVNFLVPNTLKSGSPLQKVEVRKAIYEGLDQLAIMKADGHDGTLATQLVPKEIPGYNSTITPPKMDATKAKSDLAAAGFPNGFTITFTYYAPHQKAAEEVQKELAAIGVKLTMDPQTSGPVLAKKALGGGTDLFYFGYSSSLIDSSDVIQPLAVGSANYKNAELDTLFAQTFTTFDTAARLKLLQQANKMVMDDVAVFPLFKTEGLYFAVKSNLVVQTDNLTNYSGIDFWKVYAQ